MPTDIPVEQVLSMRQQGLSNNQIIAHLQRAGYATNYILDAMNQADLREETRKPFHEPEIEHDNFQTHHDMNQRGEFMPETPTIPRMGYMNKQNPTMPTAPNFQGRAATPIMFPDPEPSQESEEQFEQGSMEEVVEAVIDEKWGDVMDNISRIIEWKEKMESKIVELDTKIKNMKGDFDKLHTAILEKVGEYDRHIQDVGTEVQALEKVFQKVLPGFIENVNELSRISSELKKAK